MSGRHNWRQGTHRKALCNKECHNPEHQQGHDWETLSYTAKVNLKLQWDTLTSHFKTWTTHLNLGFQRYIRPLAFSWAKRYSFILWEVPQQLPETDWVISGTWCAAVNGHYYLHFLVLNPKSAQFWSCPWTRNFIFLNLRFLISNMGIITYLQMTIQGEHMTHYLAQGEY